MQLPDELSRDDVLTAIAEYERGSTTHDFVESVKFDLLHEGRRYAPKAIAALATQNQTGELPVPSDFSGGVGSKCFRILQDAGFRIVPKRVPFDVGHTYTRKKIGAYLGTEEDTTKGDWTNGYHLHRDAEADIGGWWFLLPTVGDESRTGHDYQNRWVSNTELQWEGKTNSRLGQTQIDNLLSGDHPVLLFSRSHNRDPFTFHGLATPTRVEDSVPVRVIWSVEATSHDVVPTLADEDADREPKDYVPSDGDQRERVLREIRERRGQQAFRTVLLEAYENRCAISGCDVVGVLEAAHIRPYRGPDDHHPSNGLLLRSDLHTLFDLNLLGIDPTTLTIHIHPDARRPPYDAFDGNVLNPRPKLSGEALRRRWREFQR